MKKNSNCERGKKGVWVSITIIRPIKQLNKLRYRNRRYKSYTVGGGGGLFSARRKPFYSSSSSLKWPPLWRLLDGVAWLSSTSLSWNGCSSVARRRHFLKKENRKYSISYKVVYYNYFSIEKFKSNNLLTNINSQPKQFKKQTKKVT